MSATKRRAHDFYPTPPESVWALLQRIGHLLYKYTDESNWLEPAVGSADIIKAVEKWNQHSEQSLNTIWDVIDIRTDIPSLPACVQDQYCCDFLTFEQKRPYDVIVTNPPFNIAQRFIDKAKTIRASSLNPNGEPIIFMLLRLNFLGSQLRSEWWQSNLPDAIYVLSDRPDFTGDGGDSTEYAWFAWNWVEKGIFVLPPFSWEPVKQLSITNFVSVPSSDPLSVIDTARNASDYTDDVEKLEAQLKTEIDRTNSWQEDHARLEAQCAALREALIEIGRFEKCESYGEIGYLWKEALEDTDAGAALLKRLEAAEAVCECLEGVHLIMGTSDSGPLIEAWRKAKKRGGVSERRIL